MQYFLAFCNKIFLPGIRVSLRILSSVFRMSQGDGRSLLLSFQQLSIRMSMVVDTRSPL